jgi:16S rRNA (cytosine967-C5)-methyltransferase
LSKREKRAQTAREVAASVVCRTLRGQSFLSDALDAALAGTPLEPRDRALATELSFGVVRERGALVRRLSAITTRGA